jgi:hypothetical protein
MIHRDLRPFTYLYCGNCSIFERMDFCSDGTYSCGECYRFIPYVETDRKEMFFNQPLFLSFLEKQDRLRMKRFVLFYMRACNCTDEEAYDSEQIDIYCSCPALLMANHVFERQ